MTSRRGWSTMPPIAMETAAVRLELVRTKARGFGRATAGRRARLGVRGRIAIVGALALLALPASALAETATSEPPAPADVVTQAQTPEVLPPPATPSPPPSQAQPVAPPAT